MFLLNAVLSLLRTWPQPRLEGDGVLVPTHCLYPSNGIVEVKVTGEEGGSSFRMQAEPWMFSRRLVDTE